jgi:hypothetical protein
LTNSVVNLIQSSVSCAERDGGTVVYRVSNVSPL